MRIITLCSISFYFPNRGETLPPYLPRDGAVGGYAICQRNGLFEALKFEGYRNGWVQICDELFKNENDAFNYVHDHNIERCNESMKRFGLGEDSAAFKEIPYGVFLPAIQSKRM